MKIDFHLKYSFVSCRSLNDQFRTVFTIEPPFCCSVFGLHYATWHWFWLLLLLLLLLLNWSFVLLASIVNFFLFLSSMSKPGKSCLIKYYSLIIVISAIKFKKNSK